MLKFFNFLSLWLLLQLSTYACTSPDTSLFKTKRYVASIEIAERAVELAKKDSRDCPETFALIEKIKDQLE
jgi:hypothetical protein